MANHKSAKKRARQTIKRTSVNKSHMSKARTAIKALRVAIDKKDKETAQKLLPQVQSLLTKTHFKQNTIARRTSRLAAQTSQL